MQAGFWEVPSNRIFGALVVLMVIIALGSYASLNFTKIAHVDPNPPTITVSGEGEAFVVPDIGQFSFSVEAEGDTAATAQEASGTAVNEILGYLSEAGVADEDVQTTNYNLYPRWRFEERVCLAGGYCPPGERVQDGFSVSQTVTVKVRDTSAAGTLLAGVGERGATNISNLTFTTDDPTAVESEARAAAIADAKTKANKLAEQLGVQLVRIAGFSEVQFGNYGLRETQAVAFDAVEESGFAGPTIPTGENRTTAQVTITYEIQ